MTELFFFILFIIALLATGVSFAVVIGATIFGFIIMTLAGLISLFFKFLPWLVLLIFIIWLLRKKEAKYYLGKGKNKKKYFRF